MSKLLYSPSELVMQLNDAIQWRATLKNQKLVVTNGCFDLLHRGHADYLFQARMYGDALLILQNSDSSVKNLKGSKRPIINEKDRAYMLASLRCVDAVVIFDEKRCTTAIEKLMPDVYVKGGDYNLDTIDKEESFALHKYNVDISFIPFIKGLSTSNIIDKIKFDK